MGTLDGPQTFISVDHGILRAELGESWVSFIVPRQALGLGALPSCSLEPEPCYCIQTWLVITMAAVWCKPRWQTGSESLLQVQESMCEQTVLV